MARARSRRIQRFSEVVNFDDFTDGGSTAGTYELPTLVPANCVVVGWSVEVLTGFTGDSSAALLVGISGNTDMYNAAATSVSVFAAGTVGAYCDYDGSGDLGFSATARTVLLTVTSGSDFGAVDAGKMVIHVAYLEL